MEWFFFSVVVVVLAWTIGYQQGKGFARWCIIEVCDRNWPGAQIRTIRSCTDFSTIVKGRLLGRLYGKPSEWCEDATNG